MRYPGFGLLVGITCSLFVSVDSFAQKDTTWEKALFHKSNYFEPIFLDPTETQISGSYLSETSSDDPNGRYILPFSIGINKGIYRWQKSPEQGMELRFELAAFTVFEWVFLEEVWQRNLHSTDYKGGLTYNYRVRSHSFRVRLFHISSHLGDDFLIRNNVTSFTPNPINYEQLDITWAQQLRHLRYYLGFGSIIRPETIRERLSFQAGGYVHSDNKSEHKVRFLAGLDVKVFAQNSYTPGWKFGSGIEFGKPNRHPVRVIAEFYTGHMPYSVFETEKLQWLGLGLYTSI